MTQTRSPLTLAEYATYDDGTDHRHELEAGHVISMPPASPLHMAIARFLFRQFDQEILQHGEDLEVFMGDIGIRTQGTTVRQPDLCVICGEDWRRLLQEKPLAGILDGPAQMVVEIVSPGKRNRERDYQDKVREYQQIKIPEYWIVDPDVEQVVVLLLDARGNYQHIDYRNEQPIQSPIFPHLKLNPTEIMRDQHSP